MGKALVFTTVFKVCRCLRLHARAPWRSQFIPTRRFGMMASNNLSRGEEPPVTIPEGYTLHTENTSYILLPTENEAFLNPVQEFNRDLSVACIRVWSEELNKVKEAKWQQSRERKRLKTDKEIADQRGSLWPCGNALNDLAPAADQEKSGTVGSLAHGKDDGLNTPYNEPTPKLNQKEVTCQWPFPIVPEACSDVCPRRQIQVIARTNLCCLKLFPPPVCDQSDTQRKFLS